MADLAGHTLRAGDQLAADDQAAADARAGGCGTGSRRTRLRYRDTTIDVACSPADEVIVAF
ncbi:hypothetical protein Adu01nite_69370 [Paractinoplanes durhamensis]|uniref:Uncharacterized protein n=1 Tax=Paractinoplanes durhamensis TaxID=113563 RepID=A0ABQ3Z6Y4_9ACTN|nr:hypothetical protein Adu01nite_69370 [Actinoplanes durhamensis]